MTTTRADTFVQRGRLLAWALAAPAVITALSVAAIECWRLSAPDAPLFAPPVVYSLADAIERDDVERAYEFIRAGQDPNTPIAVRHAQLTGGRAMLASPLLWAAALNSQQSAQMLLGFGARLDGDTGRTAICLAAALGHREIADLLARYGGAPRSASCPPIDPRRAPLLALR